MTDSGGHTVIPGSMRPDGTFRPDIRVRAGYVPQDEVPKYMPTGAKIRQRRENADIPGLSYDDNRLSGPAAGGMTRSQKKNAAKKKSKAVKAEQVGGFDITTDVTATTAMSTAAANSKKRADGAPSVEGKKVSAENPAQQPATLEKHLGSVAASKPTSREATSNDEDRQRKLKALKKKLRQAEQLEEKAAKGELKFDAQQQEKVNRKQELVDEIAALEI